MNKIAQYRLVIPLFISVTFSGWAQHAFVEGNIRDDKGLFLSKVNVYLDRTSVGTSSNDSGFYHLTVPSGKDFSLVFSMVGYQTQKRVIHPKSNEILKNDIILSQEIKTIGEVSVTSETDRASNVSRISMKDYQQIPNPSGNFESLIKTLPGVSSSNELSSQYSVRGGNFDENLVYVNDIEITRPFLIRTGQQEGLSFINADMVSAVKFSAGGFEARYGDKMSSVLDVVYRKPVRYQASASASLLGASVSAEGIAKNEKLSYISGFRYKTSQYLLNTLDTKGDYKPSFTDFQTLISYQFSKKLEASFLGNFAQNQYQFVPQSRSTNFGTISQVYNLTVYYGGQEMDKYRSMLGAFTLHYKPIQQLSLKLIGSAYSTYEQETFDIEGQYLINELDNTSGSDSYGDSLLNLGVGGMLNHARNYLWANTYNLSHIGLFSYRDHQLRWAFDYKREIITDHLNEWTLIDSAGYSSPYSPTSIQLTDVADAKNKTASNRFSGYIQDSYQVSSKKHRFYLNGGIRFNFWDFNKELLLSPRVRISVKPGWEKDMMFHIASGIYYQPAFYKEMRNFKGELNSSILAQQSIHFVAGGDYHLTLWDRPFIFTAEMYYKHLSNLIPYKIDNVRIRYTAENNARGYATGIDFKLNGEFVPGVESWASLSLLKTEEDIIGDFYTDKNGNRIEPGYFPMPTDQRVNFNLFFQDYLPNNPTLQMHLNLLYGSSLQVSPPSPARFDQTFPIGPYRRVDIGFSKIVRNSEHESNFQWINKFKEFVVSLEFFNLLNINNKASYLWVRTISNQENMPNEFAVPNYLTSRRINLKIAMKF
jgi:hypothetical protein